MYECKMVGLEFLNTAKYCYCTEEIITATPKQIFEVLEDPDSWTVWVPIIERVEWTSPKPFGVGTTRTVFMSGGAEAHEEFIAWVPGKRMAFCFSAMSQNMMESFAEDYQVSDLGDGRCKLRWFTAMQPKGIGKLTLLLFNPLMPWFGRKWLGNFRQYVEERFATVSVAS